MTLILLDTISSPLLKGKMGVSWHKEYQYVDDAIEKDEWDAVGYLLRMDIPIRDERYVSMNVGDTTTYIPHLLVRGVKDYDGIAIGAASSGRKDIIRWMIRLGAKDIRGMITSARMFGHYDIERWLMYSNTKPKPSPVSMEYDSLYPCIMKSYNVLYSEQ